MEKLKNQILLDLKEKNLNEKVSYINELRQFIHENSPFKNEPVDFVKWVLNEDVVANDYNPNKVAPPEMELLEVSILNDGYTQPIVSWSNPEKNGKIEVIDGFHRNRVGKESKVVKQRVLGYLPVVDIRTERSNKNDRIASTIRHNRARGKHQVNAMSEIVIELKNRNWTNNKIAKQLGMDEEEVLRLCQISGLENLFSDKDFSRAWVSDDSNEKFIPIHDKLLPLEIEMYRAGNTNDPNRIFHTYDKWECQKAGFYFSKHEKYSNEESEFQFISLISDLNKFEKALNRVITEWKFSCEHYLTNKAMNRIAWLGQASVCIETGVPSSYSGAWFKIQKEKQDEANLKALEYLNKWLKNNNRSEISLKEALSEGRQVELY
jgi:hypothetical protein